MAQRRKTSPKKKAKKPGRPGRKPYEPTEEDRERVKVALGAGMRQADVRLLIYNPTTGKPISKRTLQTHFAQELEIGEAEKTFQVAEALWQRATNVGHPQGAACAIFWLKCRAGWTEKQVVQLDVDERARDIAEAAAAMWDASVANPEDTDA